MGRRAFTSLHLFLVATLFCATAVLSGCGITSEGAASSGSLVMQGTVMGGQQPVSGAQVSLYVAGSGGNGSLATNLMGTGTGSTAKYTTTDAYGIFTLAGDFTCPATTSTYTPQVYLVATGGNPGLVGNVNNTSLVMVDALGPCANLISTSKVTINEITTVAAAWALAGFATSPTNIGSTSTNGSGLANAFLNAQLIADPTAGVTPGSTLNAANTIETGKVLALADVIASCVNSDGTSLCQTLFSTSGLCASSCTSDTFSAALYIVKHPGQKVSNIFALIPANQPYATTLSLAPNDWTLSMTIAGGGLNTPTELAVDGGGNVWVANYYSADHSSGTVSAFTPQGVALTGSNGYGYGTLGTEIYGLAVDTANNVWVDIEEQPGGSGSIAGLNGITSGNTLGSVITTQTSPNIYFPESLATGINGTVIIGNYGDSTTSVFKYTPASGFNFTLANAGYGYSSQPTDVAGDANGGVWLADEGARTVTHVASNGYVMSRPSCCLAANGIATDNLGNAWVSNYYGSSVSEIGPGCDAYANSNLPCSSNPTNVVIIGANSTCGTGNATAGSCGDTNGGLSSPSKVAVDAAQNVWIVNYRGQSFTELAGNANTTLAAGAGISPTTTYNTDGSLKQQGGYGLDANLLEPFDLAPDASGNLWVSNEANSTLVMFFGIAAPTATPKQPTPVTP